MHGLHAFMDFIHMAAVDLCPFSPGFHTQNSCLTSSDLHNDAFSDILVWGLCREIRVLEIVILKINDFKICDLKI
jgi:hypothetical protein